MWAAQSGRPRPAWWGLRGPTWNNSQLQEHPGRTMSSGSLGSSCFGGGGGAGAEADPSRNSKLVHGMGVSNASPGSTLSQQVAVAKWI